MSWIKVERSTPDKPEVWAIAQELKLDADTVMGKLLRVWLWFDEQTEDGNAKSVTSVTLALRIDALTGVTGFAKAMRSTGWLNGTSIPHFDRHNGESAKKRALTTNRVKRYRNAPNVTSALPEKRREEGKPTPVVKTSRTSSSHSERESRASRLAQDWKIPEEWRTWTMAAQSSWTEGQVNLVAAGFHDYWLAKSGKDGTKNDWFATWRNWVRREGAMRAKATALATGRPRGKFDD